MRGDSNLSDSGFYRSQKSYQKKHTFFMDKIYSEARDSETSQEKINIFQRFILWLKSKLLNR